MGGRGRVWTAMDAGGPSTTPLKKNQSKPTIIPPLRRQSKHANNHSRCMVGLRGAKAKADTVTVNWFAGFKREKVASKLLVICSSIGEWPE